MKRLISFILCVLMLLSLVPATSLENGNAVFSDIRLAASDIRLAASDIRLAASDIRLAASDIQPYG